MFLDFESIERREPVTDQFASLGIIFNAGWFGDPTPLATTIQGNQNLTNFDFDAPIQNPNFISFTVHPALRVGVLVAGTVLGNTTINLRAFRDGALVADVDFFVAPNAILPGGDLPVVFAGIEVPGGFTDLELTRTEGNGAMAIDDLRFDIVPAPGTPSALAAFAFTLVAGRRRRGCTARACVNQRVRGLF